MPLKYIVTPAFVRSPKPLVTIDNFSRHNYSVIRHYSYMDMHSLLHFRNHSLTFPTLHFLLISLFFLNLISGVSSNFRVSELPDIIYAVSLLVLSVLYILLYTSVLVCIFLHIVSFKHTATFFFNYPAYHHINYETYQVGQ